jgi:hypothetical protein
MLLSTSKKTLRRKAKNEKYASEVILIKETNEVC